MLSRFKNGVNAQERTMEKIKELMIDVSSYKMSGRIDESAYSNLKVTLAELEENHSFDNHDFTEEACFEPDKVIKSLNLVELAKAENPREIVVPVDKYAIFIVSYCREIIADVLANYAIRFDRDESNTVTALRKLIHNKALEYAVTLNPILDKINIITKNKETDELRLIKPTDEEVGKVIVKQMIKNFDMFYITNAYLEKVNIIDKNETNIRNSILEIKFYNNALYILRVLLSLNIKSASGNAIDIGIAHCCRISGVKLIGETQEVIESLNKFADRKGGINFEFDFIDKVASDISDFHDDIINQKLDYNKIKDTISLLTNNVDLNLIRETIAKISVLLLTKYKTGKLASLEKLCILDGIIGKAL